MMTHVRVPLAWLLLVSLLVLSATAAPRRAPLFLVPRVDGVVSAVEAGSGKVLWSFNTGGPLVQAHTTSAEDHHKHQHQYNHHQYNHHQHNHHQPNQHPLHQHPNHANHQASGHQAHGQDHGTDQDPVVSPAEMGLLNAIQRDGLQELYPESTSILEATPFMTPDGTIFLSHKNSRMFGLDPVTGLVVSSETIPTDTSPSLKDQDLKSCFPALQIVRTEHTLETHNGTTVRYLTVAHLRVFLKDCGSSHADGTVSLDSVLLPSLTTTHLGDLQALDHQGNPLWIFNLPAPHSQLVYSLTETSLRAIRPAVPVDPLRKPALSLTNYKGTPYEISAGPKANPLALPAPNDVEHRKSTWYWVVTVCVCVAAAIWGLVILRHFAPHIPTPANPSPPSTPTRSQPVPRSNSTVQLREEHKLLQKQLQDLLLLQQEQQEKHLQQAQQLQQLQQLQELQLQQLQEQRAQHAPSDISKAVSRYRTDFDEKERLGEGGFGTVFLAINKLDGVEYAVKKVCLSSNNHKETARVLREVRHLALLDHPNIIRYFQSWIEEDEWEEWDECKIGSRMEDYDDDDVDGETTDDDHSIRLDDMGYASDGSQLDDIGHVLDLNLKASGRKRARTARVLLPSFDGGDSYEGDESNVSGILDDSQTSEDTVAITETSTREETADKPKPSKLALDRLTQLKSNDDGTFERSYGSTSNPISSDVRGTTQVRSRKTILYIQMQYCHQGTLHQWLSRPDRVVCLPEAIAIFRQAVRGVAHIHNHCVIHRDLKPPNILISGDGSVKIGDFGLATGETTDSSGPQSPHSTLSRSHTTGVGSPLYCSPEQLKGEHYDSKVDIFSLGVILYEMFHIFTTQMERVRNITELRDGYISDQTKQLYPELADLTLKLVQPNPDLRPLAKEILAHPLLSLE